MEDNYLYDFEEKYLSPLEHSLKGDLAKNLSASDDIHLDKLRKIIDKNCERNNTLKNNLSQIAHIFYGFQQNIASFMKTNDQALDELDDQKMDLNMLNKLREDISSKMVKLNSENRQIPSPVVNNSPVDNAAHGKINYTGLVERLTSQKMTMKDKIEQFKMRVFQLEKIIQEKDTSIALLEHKLESNKDVSHYKMRISELEQKLEVEQATSKGTSEIIMGELKKQLDTKIAQTLQLTKENINAKENIRKLTLDNAVLNQKLIRMQDLLRDNQHDSIIQEKLSVLIQENNSLSQRNQFQNQSIRELLRRIKELQAHVKNVEVKASNITCGTPPTTDAHHFHQSSHSSILSVLENSHSAVRKAQFLQNSLSGNSTGLGSNNSEDNNNIDGIWKGVRSMVRHNSLDHQLEKFKSSPYWLVQSSSNRDIKSRTNCHNNNGDVSTPISQPESCDLINLVPPELTVDKEHKPSTSKSSNSKTRKEQ